MILAYIWSSTNLCYYMIEYYIIYMPGDVYNNSFGASIAEIGSVLAGGFLYKYLSAKKTFVISFALSLIGGLLILILGSTCTVLMPLFVLIVKFGISLSQVSCYIAQAELFPTLFAATSIGICSFSANIVTIAAPYIAQMNEPYPVLVIVLSCAAGISLSQRITKPSKIID